MKRKLCLIFIILCPILPQGIRGESKGIKEGDVHVRKKRIIDDSLHPIIIYTIHQIPHIVNIIKNGQGTCAGSILSPVDILSAAHCFANITAFFEVFSGSIFKNGGIRHNITRKIIYPSRIPRSGIDDLALITIFPPIDLIHSPNRPIKLHPIGAPITNVATVSGWGCFKVTQENELVNSEILRSIQLAIIGSKLCQRLHPPGAPKISKKHLCTLDIRRLRSTCYGDSGGPLTMNGRQVGVLSFSSMIPNGNIPDVYMKVYDPDYTRWIITNMHYPYYP